MLNFTFKNILMVLIGILLGGAAVFWGSKILQWQNIEKQNAATERCLEDTAKMADEQLVEKINTLSSQNEGSEQLSETRRQMVKYLFCYTKANGTEEVYNKAKNLISALRIPENTKALTMKNLQDVYSSSGFKKEFFWQLAFGNREIICPEKLPQLCAEWRQQHKNIAEAKCPDYCNLFDEYQDNEERFNKEIIDYNYWSKQSLLGTSASNVTSGRVTARLSIILQLKNEDLARQFCESLPAIKLADIETTTKDFCFEKLETFLKTRPSNKLECEKLREGTARLMCSAGE